MTIKTEFLNFLTGVLLILSGLLSIFHGEFEMSMNWIIFGSMYLVMDDCLQNEKYQTLLEKLTDYGRKIFSWVGLAGSVCLLGYYIHNFWF